MTERAKELILRIQKCERLDRSEYLWVYENADLHTLTAAADEIRRKLFGRKTFYIQNCHINYTNICIGKCDVCSFSRKAGNGDGFTLTIEEIERIARTAGANGIAEFHVVGGLNPDLKYEYYIGILRAIRCAAPNAAVKAFTAVEIDHISRIAARPVEAVLTEFTSAGLDSLPGGGAEIFSKDYRQKYFPNKISGKRWLEIHRIAHSLKIPTSATMLYNNSETAAERIEHMLTLRDAQDESLKNFGTGFLCFVPLSCKSENNKTASAVLDLRTMAISRIILDNIRHIKAFWPILGWDIAQLALLSGADDLDGAIEDYKIVAGSYSIDIKKMTDCIAQIGLIPTRRSSFYD